MTAQPNHLQLRNAVALGKQNKVEEYCEFLSYAHERIEPEVISSFD
jgi:hypothetical protein